MASRWRYMRWANGGSCRRNMEWSTNPCRIQSAVTAWISVTWDHTQTPQAAIETSIFLLMNTFFFVQRVICPALHGHPDIAMAVDHNSDKKFLNVLQNRKFTSFARVYRVSMTWRSFGMRSDEWSWSAYRTSTISF